MLTHSISMYVFLISYWVNWIRHINEINNNLSSESGIRIDIYTQKCLQASDFSYFLISEITNDRFTNKNCSWSIEPAFITSQVRINFLNHSISYIILFCFFSLPIHLICFVFQTWFIYIYFYRKVDFNEKKKSFLTQRNGNLKS